jgi:UDP-glucose 4-epimerase
MVLPRFIGAAKAGEPLKVLGDGKQTRCFCYVNDVIEALVRLQNCPAARGEVFNVGSEEEISIRELAALVIASLNSPSAIEFVPYQQAHAHGFEDMLRRKPVVDKLAARIGIQPRTSLREIIRLTVSAS